MNLTGGYALLWCTACPPVGTGLRTTRKQREGDMRTYTVVGYLTDGYDAGADVVVVVEARNATEAASTAAQREGVVHGWAKDIHVVAVFPGAHKDTRTVYAGV